MAGTNIFSTGAGTVVQLDGEAAPVLFSIDDGAHDINDLRAIVTSVGIQAQSGFQFMHALREFIYLYVFTERIGEIIVNGLAFPATCNFGPVGPQEEGDCVVGVTGLERVITWYECNRVTARAAPIFIVFGGQLIYEAFLVGMKADIIDASTGIAQFAFRFNFVPRVSDRDDLCFPVENSCLEAPCESDDDEVVDD